MVNDVHVVQEPVEDRRRQDLVPGEDLWPVTHVLVRGQHDASALVARRDEAEEQVRLHPVQGPEAHLIDDCRVEARARTVVRCRRAWPRRRAQMPPATVANAATGAACRAGAAPACDIARRWRTAYPARPNTAVGYARHPFARTHPL